MIKRVDPAALRRWLLDGEELALFDVREELVFGGAHMLYASCLPLSRLELEVGALAPRRSVRMVVCDGGEGLAERAASRLGILGYTDVSVLEGGYHLQALADSACLHVETLLSAREHLEE